MHSSVSFSTDACYASHSLIKLHKLLTTGMLQGVYVLGFTFQKTKRYIGNANMTCIIYCTQQCAYCMNNRRFNTATELAGCQSIQIRRWGKKTCWKMEFYYQPSNQGYYNPLSRHEQLSSYRPRVWFSIFPYFIIWLACRSEKDSRRGLELFFLQCTDPWKKKKNWYWSEGKHKTGHADRVNTEKIDGQMWK